MSTPQSPVVPAGSVGPGAALKSKANRWASASMARNQSQQSNINNTIGTNGQFNINENPNGINVQDDNDTYDGPDITDSIRIKNETDRNTAVNRLSSTNMALPEKQQIIQMSPRGRVNPEQQDHQHISPNLAILTDTLPNENVTIDMDLNQTLTTLPPNVSLGHNNIQSDAQIQYLSTKTNETLAPQPIYQSGYANAASAAPQTQLAQQPGVNNTSVLDLKLQQLQQYQQQSDGISSDEMDSVSTPRAKKVDHNRRDTASVVLIDNQDISMNSPSSNSQENLLSLNDNQAQIQYQQDYDINNNIITDQQQLVDKKASQKSHERDHHKNRKRDTRNKDKDRDRRRDKDKDRISRHRDTDREARGRETRVVNINNGNGSQEYQNQYNDQGGPNLNQNGIQKSSSQASNVVVNRNLNRDTVASAPNQKRLSSSSNVRQSEGSTTNLPSQQTVSSTSKSPVSRHTTAASNLSPNNLPVTDRLSTVTSGRGRRISNRGLIQDQWTNAARKCLAQQGNASQYSTIKASNKNINQTVRIDMTANNQQQQQTSPSSPDSTTVNSNTGAGPSSPASPLRNKWKAVSGKARITQVLAAQAMAHGNSNQQQNPNRSLGKGQFKNDPDINQNLFGQADSNTDLHKKKEILHTMFGNITGGNATGTGARGENHNTIVDKKISKQKSKMLRNKTLSKGTLVGQGGGGGRKTITDGVTDHLQDNNADNISDQNLSDTSDIGKTSDSDSNSDSLSTPHSKNSKDHDHHGQNQYYHKTKAPVQDADNTLNQQHMTGPVKVGLTTGIGGAKKITDLSALVAAAKIERENREKGLVQGVNQGLRGLQGIGAVGALPGPNTAKNRFKIAAQKAATQDLNWNTGITGMGAEKGHHHYHHHHHHQEKVQSRPSAKFRNVAFAAQTVGKMKSDYISGQSNLKQQGRKSQANNQQTQGTGFQNLVGQMMQKQKTTSQAQQQTQMPMNKETSMGVTSRGKNLNQMSFANVAAAVAAQNQNQMNQNEAQQQQQKNQWQKLLQQQQQLQQQQFLNSLQRAGSAPGPGQQHLQQQFQNNNQQNFGSGQPGPFYHPLFGTMPPQLVAALMSQFNPNTMLGSLPGQQGPTQTSTAAASTATSNLNTSTVTTANTNASSNLNQNQQQQQTQQTQQQAQQAPGPAEQSFQQYLQSFGPGQGGLARILESMAENNNMSMINMTLAAQNLQSNQQNQSQQTYTSSVRTGPGSLSVANPINQSLQTIGTQRTTAMSNVNQSLASTLAAFRPSDIRTASIAAANLNQSQNQSTASNQIQTQSQKSQPEQVSDTTSGQNLQTGSDTKANQESGQTQTTTSADVTNVDDNKQFNVQHLQIPIPQFGGNYSNLFSFDQSQFDFSGSGYGDPYGQQIGTSFGGSGLGYGPGTNNQSLGSVQSDDKFDQDGPIKRHSSTSDSSTYQQQKKKKQQQQLHYPRRLFKSSLLPDERPDIYPFRMGQDLLSYPSLIPMMIMDEVRAAYNRLAFRPLAKANFFHRGMDDSFMKQCKEAEVANKKAAQQQAANNASNIEQGQQLMEEMEAQQEQNLYDQQYDPEYAQYDDQEQYEEEEEQEDVEEEDQLQQDDPGHRKVDHENVDMDIDDAGQSNNENGQRNKSPSGSSDSDGGSSSSSSRSGSKSQDGSIQNNDNDNQNNDIPGSVNNDLTTDQQQFQPNLAAATLGEVVGEDYGYKSGNFNQYAQQQSATATLKNTNSLNQQYVTLANTNYTIQDEHLNQDMNISMTNQNSLTHAPLSRAGTNNEVLLDLSDFQNSQEQIEQQPLIMGNIKPNINNQDFLNNGQDIKDQTINQTVYQAESSNHNVNDINLTLKVNDKDNENLQNVITTPTDVELPINSTLSSPNARANQDREGGHMSPNTSRRYLQQQRERNFNGIISNYVNSGKKSLSLKSPNSILTMSNTGCSNIRSLFLKKSPKKITSGRSRSSSYNNTPYRAFTEGEHEASLGYGSGDNQYQSTHIEPKSYSNQRSVTVPIGRTIQTRVTRRHNHETPTDYQSDSQSDHAIPKFESRNQQIFKDGSHSMPPPASPTNNANTHDNTTNSPQPQQPGLASNRVSNFVRSPVKSPRGTLTMGNQQSIFPQLASATMGVNTNQNQNFNLTTEESLAQMQNITSKATALILASQKQGMGSAESLQTLPTTVSNGTSAAAVNQSVNHQPSTLSNINSTMAHQPSQQNATATVARKGNRIGTGVKHFKSNQDNHTNVQNLNSNQINVSAGPSPQGGRSPINRSGKQQQAVPAQSQVPSSPRNTNMNNMNQIQNFVSHSQSLEQQIGHNPGHPGHGQHGAISHGCNSQASMTVSSALTGPINQNQNQQVQQIQSSVPLSSHGGGGPGGPVGQVIHHKTSSTGVQSNMNVSKEPSSVGAISASYTLQGGINNSTNFQQLNQSQNPPQSPRRPISHGNSVQNVMKRATSISHGHHGPGQYVQATNKLQNVFGTSQEVVKMRSTKAAGALPSSQAIALMAMASTKSFDTKASSSEESDNANGEQETQKQNSKEITYDTSGVPSASGISTPQNPQTDRDQQIMMKKQSSGHVPSPTPQQTQQQAGDAQLQQGSAPVSPKKTQFKGPGPNQSQSPPSPKKRIKKAQGQAQGGPSRNTTRAGSVNTVTGIQLQAGVGPGAGPGAGPGQGPGTGSQSAAVNSAGMNQNNQQQNQQRRGQDSTVTLTADQLNSNMKGSQGVMIQQSRGQGGPRSSIRPGQLYKTINFNQQSAIHQSMGAKKFNNKSGGRQSQNILGAQNQQSQSAAEFAQAAGASAFQDYDFGELDSDPSFGVLSSDDLASINSAANVNSNTQLNSKSMLQQQQNLNVNNNAAGSANVQNNRSSIGTTRSTQFIVGGIGSKGILSKKSQVGNTNKRGSVNATGSKQNARSLRNQNSNLSLNAGGNAEQDNSNLNDQQLQSYSQRNSTSFNRNSNMNPQIKSQSKTLSKDLTAIDSLAQNDDSVVLLDAQYSGGGGPGQDGNFGIQQRQSIQQGLSLETYDQQNSKTFENSNQSGTVTGLNKKSTNFKSTRFGETQSNIIMDRETTGSSGHLSSRQNVNNDDDQDNESISNKNLSFASRLNSKVQKTLSQATNFGAAFTNKASSKTGVPTKVKKTTTYKKFHNFKKRIWNKKILKFRKTGKFLFLILGMVYRSIGVNYYFMVPLMLIYVFFSSTCTLSTLYVEGYFDEPIWNFFDQSHYDTCKLYALSEDFTPAMLIGTLPSFMVVFYTSQSLARYFGQWNQCMCQIGLMQDIITSARIDFAHHPRALIEVWRCLNLAHILVYTGLSPSTYSYDGFLIPITSCYGNRKFGLLSEKERLNLKENIGYGADAARMYWTRIKAIYRYYSQVPVEDEEYDDETGESLGWVQKREGQIMPPIILDEENDLENMKEIQNILNQNHSNGKVKTIVPNLSCKLQIQRLDDLRSAAGQLYWFRDMQISPTYSMLVALVLLVVCYNDAFTKGHAIGVAIGSGSKVYLIIQTFFNTIIQQFVLVGLLGVASEMVDPFGDDLHDFPIFSLIKTGLQTTLNPIISWGEYVDIIEPFDNFEDEKEDMDEDDEYYDNDYPYEEEDLEEEDYDNLEEEGEDIDNLVEGPTSADSSDRGFYDDNGNWIAVEDDEDQDDKDELSGSMKNNYSSTNTNSNITTTLGPGSKNFKTTNKSTKSMKSLASVTLSKSLKSSMSKKSQHNFKSQQSQNQSLGKQLKSQQSLSQSMGKNILKSGGSVSTKLNQSLKSNHQLKKKSGSGSVKFDDNVNLQVMTNLSSSDQEVPVSANHNNKQTTKSNSLNFNKSKNTGPVGDLENSRSMVHTKSDTKSSIHGISNLNGTASNIITAFHKSRSSEYLSGSGASSPASIPSPQTVIVTTNNNNNQPIHLVTQSQKLSGSAALISNSSKSGGGRSSQSQKLVMTGQNQIQNLPGLSGRDTAVTTYIPGVNSPTNTNQNIQNNLNNLNQKRGSTKMPGLPKSRISTTGIPGGIPMGSPGMGSQSMALEDQRFAINRSDSMNSSDQ